MCAIDDDRHGLMWMPLTDDGDALRLAVKLGLRVKVEKNDHAEVDNRMTSRPCAGRRSQMGKTFMSPPAAPSSAAAIGKAMK